MVVVAQLAELWVVVPAVAGSSPVYHPSWGISGIDVRKGFPEHLADVGSNPTYST
jgi:hypothetical protein